MGGQIKCDKYGFLTVSLILAVTMHLSLVTQRACSEPAPPFLATMRTIFNTPVTHVPRTQGIRDIARMREILTVAKKELTYIIPANMVTMTMAKAGSSMTWIWLYSGLTGQDWNTQKCGNLHNRSSTCWAGLIKPVREMNEIEQWRLMTSPTVFRLAIQRHPYARLLSAYKSKYTCERTRFQTDAGQKIIVPYLRKQLGLPQGEACMNLTEFGHALGVARRNVGKQGFPLRDLHRIENHIRPQEFFFNEIHYDVVLDVSDLSRANRIAPVNRRLPFRNGMNGKKRDSFASGNAILHVPEDVAVQLHDFTLLSKHGSVKYID